MNKIKRHHNNKPMSTRRLIQLLKQHRYDTGLMTAFVTPPFTPEDFARAQALAASVDAALNNPSQYTGPVGEAQAQAARIAALVDVLRYQARVGGVVKYLEDSSRAATQPPVDVTKTHESTNKLICDQDHEHGPGCYMSFASEALK